MMKEIMILVVLVLSTTTMTAQLLDNTDDNFKRQDYLDGHLSIYKNLSNSTLLVTDLKNKIVYKDLKYCEIINREFLQAITADNEMIYIDGSLNKIDEAPPLTYLVCGTVNDYEYKLQKQGDKYLVYRTVDDVMAGVETVTEAIDSISALGLKDIYFINKQKSLRFDDNFPIPVYIILETDSKYGVYENGKSIMFDSVSYYDYLKIEDDGLFHFYHLSKTGKYKTLADFQNNLAKFELPDGTIGHIDIQGVEYY